MILHTIILSTLCLKLTLAAEAPLSTSEDISQINNLRSDEAPRVNIDPRLRRALLRVLTKLDEEDKRNGNHDSARQMAEVMQNIISEEDFVKYFQEQGLEKELLESFESDKEDPKDVPNLEEILSFSSEDTNKERETPFTFASYPEDKLEGSTQKNIQEAKNSVKYPSTNPTPQLGDAIFFQIPEPIHIQDSVVDVDEDEEGKQQVNIQETRSIQGPTLVSPTESNNYHQESREEQKVTFIINDDANKDSIKDEDESVRTTNKQEKEDFPEDFDEKSKTSVDFQSSNGTEIEDTEDVGNSSMKVKLEKHEVEFLHSSLLAAFTVQQDQQGLPRRVIPLNYQSSGDPIPLPNNKDQQLRSNTQISLEDKQKELQQQVKFLQEQQLQEQQYRRLQEFVKERQRLLQEEEQRQFVLENQKRQYENEQRIALARQRQQQILFQTQQDNALDTLKELERQRYFQQQQYNFNQPQNVHFQKSVDYQFQTKVQPSQALNQLPLSNFQQSFSPFNSPFQHTVELNRVNRQEASNAIGNFGLSTPRPTLNFRSAGLSSTVTPFVQPQRQNFIKPSVLIQPSQSTFIQPSNYIQTNQITQSNFVPSSNYFQQNYNQHRFAPVTRPPLTVDSQIQSLLSITGIGQGKPSAQEDLNIVSKVLALGHGERQFLGQQFQASTRHEQVVKPPSRVIEPPKL